MPFLNALPLHVWVLLGFAALVLCRRSYIQIFTPLSTNQRRIATSVISQLSLN